MVIRKREEMERTKKQKEQRNLGNIFLHSNQIQWQLLASELLGRWSEIVVRMQSSMLVCIMVKHTQKNYKESLVQQPPNKCFCILWPAQACMMPARGWQSVSPKFSPLTCSLPGSCWDSSVSFCTRHPLSCLCRQPHLSQANLITSKYVFTYCWTQCL